MCGCEARTTIVRTTPEQEERLMPDPEGSLAPVVRGICEACAVHLYWIWHEVEEDADPTRIDEHRREAEKVKVILSRLPKLAEGTANPEVPESYELAMSLREGVDFPSVDLLPGESYQAAAVRALDKHGYITWQPFVEPLYAALSPRGRLARVVLVTAYTQWQTDVEEGGSKLREAPAGGLVWRRWPPWEEASDLSSLYLALRDVWPLRLWKRLAREQRLEGVTTCLRRAAAEFLYMQQALRAGKKDVDTSASELLRRNMSDDEKVIVKKLEEQEGRLVVFREQELAEKGPEIQAPPAAAPEMPEAPEPVDLVPGEISEDGEDDPFAGEPEDSS
jgi:hypothetical protein